MLDETLPKGEFDFVEEIAGPIPIRVLGHMLGVPDEHLDKLVELGDRMLVPTDPDLTPPSTLTPEESKYLPFGSEAGAELLELGRPLIEERKGHPCGDVLSILANAEIGGCPVSQHDLDNNLALLVVAGNETTRQGMALGMLALMEHPDQLELLRSDPSIMPSAVDELIRYASPVWHFRRTAVADTELRGVTIRKGERVVVWFAAANRDPEAFPDPHRLDLTRKRDVHAAFGRGGPHFCLGAHLARLEMAVLFEQLLPRIASIELTGPPARLRSNFTNGLKRLPVRVVEAADAPGGWYARPTSGAKRCVRRRDERTRSGWRRSSATACGSCASPIPICTACCAARTCRSASSRRRSRRTGSRSARRSRRSTSATTSCPASSTASATSTSRRCPRRSRSCRGRRRWPGACPTSRPTASPTAPTRAAR